MSEGKVMGTNTRFKRSTFDEDEINKDEPPFKSQRLYLPFNDDHYSQGPVNDSQFDNCEITEYNYDKVSATTMYKKLQVLETRDRILRATSTQPTTEINVEDIQPMVGTCYDMCPEKERLLRIHGNMVSQFECKMVDSKMEPVVEIMIKQYARSSADQANPLSHELRPTFVLVKTMNYMLKRIIYPIESNIEQDLASWYDFCWDRLRAIRKDIVQQNLQNSEVITILEQIGRFHIACYDLMLGYAGFDIKLNTENLNNCIQMLMPMYRDSDRQCPNEPEFVSYELLMHLGNPQFHTTYDLLPIHIKQTPQVRFCIKAHSTYLQSSDCMEFFNLLKNTTFMNCCILQRVIPSIRYNVIKMINMSYTTAKRIYKLEMKHLMEKLCFDDIQLAQEFCSDIHLKCDDKYVDLSRKIAIHAPENRLQRQEFIIIQKRKNLTYLISRTQNLPDVIVNSVHSSFDNNDRFNYSANIQLNKELNNDTSDSQILMDTYSSNSKDDINHGKLFSTTPIQPPTVDIPMFTFKLPMSSPTIQVQTTRPNFETLWKPLPPLSIRHDDSSNQSNLSSSFNSYIPNSLTNSSIIFSQDLFMKPLTSTTQDDTASSMQLHPIHSSPSKTPYKIDFKEKLQCSHLTETQIKLVKKYFSKWQNCVNCRKSKYIEDMFAHGELFHSECISSLSSSVSSVKSLYDFNDIEVYEEPEEWAHKQLVLARKYFYIWLRKILRRRIKIEIDPVNSMPWSLFLKVHGTPKETFESSMKLYSKMKSDGKKRLTFPIDDPLSYNITKDDDISDKIANLFVKNVLNTKKVEVIGKKIFWKLAVNYGDSPKLHCIENKVQTIIYGKIGFSNSQIQSIYTDYNTYFIKSVQSCIGLQDWTKSGLNAALVFTNTGIEDMETLFKRVESILNSTPIAIPLVLIFSSSSNKNEIENYQSVLEAYRENEYINNYSIYTWEGPKTILESIEFFSKHYVDITPGMHSENLFYNLLNFAQSFYLKVRHLLPEDNPNTIIEKYNQYLDAYIKRLGRSNRILQDCAPELIPYYTQNPNDFSKKYSNLNVEYFEGILNDAHLPLYESWPPKNVDDIIDYVKNMCHITNRRCWCLDLLQILQLHRKADLENCLSDGNWYEPIEMWIQGALEKCCAQDRFTVFYNGDPITDVLKIVFPDS